MKKIILSILILILLTGCSGLYNLNNFILPDDIEFLALIEELDTPEKICQYMADNFTYELYAFYTPDPYMLWQIKQGDCNDFATFGMFMANHHNYETYLLEIYFKNYFYNHYVAIYIEGDYYNFSDNQYYFTLKYSDFKNIAEFISSFMYQKYGYIYLKYIIYDYDMNIVETGYK
jgi:hypothetical protein